MVMLKILMEKASFWMFRDDTHFLESCVCDTGAREEPEGGDRVRQEYGFFFHTFSTSFFFCFNTPAKKGKLFGCT